MSIGSVIAAPFALVSVLLGLLLSAAPFTAADADGALATWSGAGIHTYDSSSTVTTSTIHARTSALRSYDDRAHASRHHIRVSSGVLATKPGGAGPVRVGQAGEDAVRGAYDIGDKVPIRVAGRGRIPDGLTPSTLSEVKNVASLSYTRQLSRLRAVRSGDGTTCTCEEEARPRTCQARSGKL